jgi:hypothetical protein
MSSPIALVGLTYDGVDLQPADLQFFLVITHGLNETPTVRGVDVVVPALAGQIEYNRVNDTLPLVLEGFCRADPEAGTADEAHQSYRSNQQALRSLFASNRARADLVALLEDGTQLRISARPLPGQMWVENVPSTFSTISIELTGNDDWVAEVAS